MTSPEVLSNPVGSVRMGLVMVGLPARGKTFIAQKVARYLRWRGVNTEVFNVGNYRRDRVGAHQKHLFFDPDNPEGLALRRQFAMAALDDMIAWLGRGGQVGIYDATNSTRQRRDAVRRRCEEAGLDVVFVETICNDAAIVDNNVRQTKATSPDYEGVDSDAAVRDFRQRISHYERVYEPVDELDGAFVKLIDVGKRVVAHNIRGYLPARLVYFLMNLHIQPRPILLSRHGQSAYNVLGRIGGDAGLSPLGKQYAGSLAEFVRGYQPAPTQVWCSTLRRATETARSVTPEPLGMRALCEIDAGECDGLTYEEIRRQHPQEFAARAKDKLRYRYPRGESYEDVIQRLEPVIVELERQREPVLVVSHQAVLRALVAYLMDEPRHKCPYLHIPLHTVIELTPRAYGADERRFLLPPPVGTSGTS